MFATIGVHPELKYDLIQPTKHFCLSIITKWGAFYLLIANFFAT